MSQRGLEALLHPKSITVFGALQQPGRTGHLDDEQLTGGRLQRPGTACNAALYSSVRRDGLSRHRQPATAPIWRSSAPTPNAIYPCWRR